MKTAVCAVESGNESRMFVYAAVKASEYRIFVGAVMEGSQKMAYGENMVKVNESTASGACTVILNVAGIGRLDIVVESETESQSDTSPSYHGKDCEIAVHSAVDPGCTILTWSVTLRIDHRAISSLIDSVVLKGFYSSAFGLACLQKPSQHRSPALLRHPNRHCPLFQHLSRTLLHRQRYHHLRHDLPPGLEG